MTNPSELELMELYRDWWKASYGAAPNAQATVVAAAFARHVLATYSQPAESTGQQGCVYHPTMTGEQRDD
jgi:hypothetical protein